MARRLGPSVLVMLLAGAGAASQSHLYTQAGAQKFASFGHSVSGAGDVDRDGHADVVVGAFSEGTTGRARVFSGRTGKVLFTFQGAQSGDRCGWSVAGPGDLDGDGYADVLVGIPTTANRPGSARLYSGRTGLVLRTFKGSSNRDYFGGAVSAAGDVDRDGTPDLIVGAPQDKGRRGSARVFSGRSGALIRVVSGDAAGDGFGFSASGAGDVDHDSYADFVVGAEAGSLGRGYARVFSGKNGTVLRTVRGARGDGFAYSLDAGADIDRDTYPDFVVGAWADDDKGQQSGSATVFSGKDGSKLRMFLGDGPGDQLGVAVRFLPDLNRDRVAELLVGMNRATSRKRGAARVFSGKDGRVVFTLEGRSAADNFGFAVASAGDVDADGVPDIVAGAMHEASRGTASVFSGRRLPFTTDVHCVSVSRGGISRFRLEAGARHAGKLYVVIGSQSGTTPGVKLGAVTLPLNFDAYMLFTVSQPNSLILAQASALDASGNGMAMFALPPGLPLRAGLLLHHAYVVVDLRARTFDFTSNARPLTLVR